MAKQSTFEQSLNALEDAVARLEKGQLPLDEALASFEIGVKSAGRCRELLRDVETRVEMLLKDNVGNLRLETFETDDDGDDEE